MTSEQVIAKLKRLDLKARFAVGSQIISEVLPFVPIASGELRRSGRVEQEINNVVVIFGGKAPGARADVQYAAFQHDERIFHLGKRGQYKSLGSTSKLYAENYREAKDAKRLTKSRAKWFKVVTKQKKVKNKLVRIYTNVVEKGL